MCSLVVTGLLLSATTATGQVPPRPLPGIAIRDGRFVVRESGKPFRPVGFNYIRLFNEAGTADHDNFSHSGFDPREQESMLRQLAASGFNTVRVFINFQTGEVVANRDSDELSAVYLDNVCQFLKLARQHGVYVVFSVRRHPELARYQQLRGPPIPHVTGENQRFLHPGWLRAKTVYLQDFLRELIVRDPSALGAVFAIDIQNEVCFYPAAEPFCLSSGSFTSPDGRTYDLATEKQTLADDAAIRCINTYANGIRKVLPGVLVDVNIFTFAAVGRKGPGDFHIEPAGWKNRVPFRPLAIVRSKADMIDVHFYCGSLEEYRRDLASIEFDQLRPAARAAGKPLIVGEFGLFKSRFESDFAASCRFLKQSWLPVLNRDWDGWLFWTYDTREQPRLWNAMDQGGKIYRILKP